MNKWKETSGASETIDEIVQNLNAIANYATHTKVYVEFPYFQGKNRSKYIKLVQVFPVGSDLFKLFDSIRTELQELKARDVNKIDMSYQCHGTMLRKAVKDHMGVSYSADIEALVRVGYNNRKVLNEHYLSRS